MLYLTHTMKGGLLAMANSFAVGDIVKHRLTGDRCMVIRKGNEQLLIRTPNYKEIWVYVHELEASSEK